MTGVMLPSRSAFRIPFAPLFPSFFALIFIHVGAWSFHLIILHRASCLLHIASLLMSCVSPVMPRSSSAAPCFLCACPPPRLTSSVRHLRVASHPWCVSSASPRFLLSSPPRLLASSVRHVCVVSRPSCVAFTFPRFLILSPPRCLASSVCRLRVSTVSSVHLVPVSSVASLLPPLLPAFTRGTVVLTLLLSLSPHSFRILRPIPHPLRASAVVFLRGCPHTMGPPPGLPFCSVRHSNPPSKHCKVGQ